METNKNSEPIGSEKGLCGLVIDPSDKEEPAIAECQGKTPILKEIEPSFGSSAAGLNSLLIEGDNYQSLYSMFLLEKRLSGIADIVYVDPPYNTKYHYDKAFSDNKSCDTDSFSHSEWLRKLRSRLSLSECLMTNDGVMLMSIGEREFAASKLLCDQIFGEANSLGTIIWDKGSTHSNSASIANGHEYVLAYRKSDSKKRLLVSKEISNREVHEDSNGKYVLIPCNYIGSLGLNERPNNGYLVFADPKDGSWRIVNEYNHDAARTSNDESMIYDKEVIKKMEALGYVRAKPDRYGDRLGCWAWSVSKAIDEVKKGKTIMISNGAGTYKFFHKEYLEKGKDCFLRASPMPSILSYPSCDGTRELKKVLGYETGFTYPKSVDLMKKLIGSYYRKDPVVLDIYAGSGTTAQAIMELNKEDGGSRRFILCNNDESNIFSKCCLPRVKVLATGVREDGSTLKGGSFAMKIFVCQTKMETKPTKDEILRSKALFDAVLPK